MYLFHRVEERLNGQPSIIVVDEGWKALDDEVFVTRIRDWEKTIRKRNGIVGFATQSTGDALESRIASAVIEQSATQIFLPNPKAQESEYCKGFRPLGPRVRPHSHPARYITLLPCEARGGKRRRAAQPQRRARPADGSVGPRAHRAHARRHPRGGWRQPGGLDAAAGGGGIMAFCPAPPEEGMVGGVIDTVDCHIRILVHDTYREPGGARHAVRDSLHGPAHDLHRADRLPAPVRPRRHARDGAAVRGAEGRPDPRLPDLMGGLPDADLQPAV